MCICQIIQNCDDNSYKGDVEPSLIIRLTEELIEFENNEIGFSERDVESICSIGQSSKANRKGFIGHKGIGFKSVFKICSNPKIHSNEFHFELAAEAKEGEESAGLEYIVPQPVPAPAGWRAGSGTKIVLPIASSRRREIQKCIKDLEETILLFLRKLRVIEIHDSRAQDGSVHIRRMRREVEVEGNFDLVSLANVVDGEESSQDWLVLKTNVAEKTQDDLCLQLAVPFMHELGAEQDYRQRDVFAYLPVRCYGFRFIVNGDFAVTSSRESVDTMDSRNLRLRDGIAKHFPTLILELQERYLSATKHNQEAERDVHVGEYTRVVMSVLPTPGEVNDFFAVVPDQIRTAIDGLELVPLRTGKFVKARCAVWRPRKVESEVISFLEELLAKEGLGFVHDAVAKYQVLGEHIGIRRLQQVFPSILKHLEQRLQSSPPDDLTMECLAWIFNELRDEEDVAVRREVLQRKLIPLASGNFVKPQENSVYALHDVFDLCLDPSPSFRILHPLFAEKIQMYGRGLTSFLKEMNVVWNNAEAFLRSQLMPVLHDQESEEKKLVTGLILLKKVLEQQSEQDRRLMLLDIRQKGIVLLDEQGDRVWSCNALHQGPSYSKHADRVTDIVGRSSGSMSPVPWKLVSSKYLEKDQDAGGWRAVFLGLGILTFCHIREPGYTSEEMRSLYRSIVEANEALEPKRQRLQLFFSLLSDVWQEEYEQALGLPEEGEVVFLTFLRQEAKLPGTDSLLHPPQLLLQRTEHVYRVLEAKGIYPDVDNLDVKLSQRLGISSQLQPSNIFDQFEHWRSSSTPLSLSFMENVYKCLRSDQSSWSSSSERRCIFVPDKHSVMKLVTQKGKEKYVLDASVETAGKWYSATSLVLRDPSYLLDTDRIEVTRGMNDYCCQGDFRAVEAFYKNVLDVLSGFGVREEPPYEFYTSLLKRLERESSSEITAVEKLACKLRVLVHFSFEFDDTRSNLRPLYADQPRAHPRTLGELLALVRETKLSNKWVQKARQLETAVRWMRDHDVHFPGSDGSSVALSACLGIYEEDAVARRLDTLGGQVGFSAIELQSSARWMDVVKQSVCLRHFEVSDGKPFRADQGGVAVKGYPLHLARFYHEVLDLPHLAGCIEEEVKAKDKVAGMKVTIPVASDSTGRRDEKLSFLPDSESESGGGGLEVSDPDLLILCSVLEAVKRFAGESSHSVQVVCVQDLYVHIGIRQVDKQLKELLTVEKRITSQRVSGAWVMSVVQGTLSHMSEEDDIVHELVRCLSALLNVQVSSSCLCDTLT